MFNQNKKNEMSKIQVKITSLYYLTPTPNCRFFFKYSLSSIVCWMNDLKSDFKIFFVK